MIKRLLDATFALAGLVVFLPLLGVIAIAVRMACGRPVLFSQIRPGLNGRPFKIFKFRTMIPIEQDNARPSDAERLTRLGRFLRATSLDELPELWNVLKGDMSFVGPRPLLMEYLERYSPEQMRRHEVRPGITGWAQIHGRNDTTWDERLARDVWYVDHRSLVLDLKILLRTVFLVLRRQGVSARGHATMPEFRGPASREKR